MESRMQRVPEPLNFDKKVSKVRERSAGVCWRKPNLHSS
jgi:hypothetical protein